MRLRVSEIEAEVKVEVKVEGEAEGEAENKDKVETICTRVLLICLFGKSLLTFL